MSAKGSSRIWTAENIAKLRELFPTTPSNDIADLIGCSDCTVLNKAHELGLKRDPSFHKNNFIGRYVHKGQFRKL